MVNWWHNGYCWKRNQCKGESIPATSRSVLTFTARVAGDGKPRCCYCHQPTPQYYTRMLQMLHSIRSYWRKHGSVSYALRGITRVGTVAHPSHVHIVMATIILFHVTTQPTKSQVMPVNLSAQTGRASTPWVQQVTTQPPSPQTSATVIPHTSATTGLYCVNVNTPVLFQTAQAYIHKPNDPENSMVIQLILDGSYITQRVKDALDLEPEEVHIRTFGSRTQTVEMVTAAVCPNRGSPISLSFVNCCRINPLLTWSSTITI